MALHMLHPQNFRINVGRQNVFNCGCQLNLRVLYNELDREITCTGNYFSCIRWVAGNNFKIVTGEFIFKIKKQYFQNVINHTNSNKKKLYTHHIFFQKGLKNIMALK